MTYLRLRVYEKHNYDKLYKKGVCRGKTLLFHFSIRHINSLAFSIKMDNKRQISENLYYGYQNH